jgi:hypothetical protein
MQVFLDSEGSVVLSFDSAAAAAEGDLTSYLNHQEKHGSIMVEFRWEAVHSSSQAPVLQSWSCALRMQCGRLTQVAMKLE